MTIYSADPLIELPKLAVAFVASARAIGFVLGFPFFAWLDIPAIIRLPIAVGLSMPAISIILTDYPDDAKPIAGAMFVFLIAKEVLIGLAIGLVLGIPVYGFQAAGDIIDTLRNALSTNQLDPMAAAPASDSGRLFGGLALLWMVMSGAFPFAIDLFFQSFRVLPVFATSLSEQATLSLASVLTDIAAYGMRFAVPLIIVSLAIKAIINFSALSGGATVSEVSPLLEALAYVLFLSLFLAASLTAMSIIFQNEPSGILGLTAS